MVVSRSKYIIVGAGLSGLTTGYMLKKQGEEDFLILEGRDRYGGRIWTKEAIDLGATWFQDHHSQLSQLVDELGLQKFPQYTKGRGIFVYSSMAPPQYFDNEHNGTPTYRIGGGSNALIEALAIPISEKIEYNAHVKTVVEEKDGITVRTDQGDFIAEKIIIAIPPKIAANIAYSPTLPPDLVEAMLKTHTWMSNAIKVGITFREPFWRDKNLSGAIIGHISPVIELYDHTNQASTAYSLMGFVNEGLRDLALEERKERILSYLEKHFGAAVRDHLGYFEKDWSVDPFTSDQNLKSVYISPSYGNPLLQTAYMQGKLLFSGAETSSVHGGYMDGAVISGIKAANFLTRD